MNRLIRLEAPAKINITLEVLRKLRSGYHAIRSVLVRLDDLSDTVELRVIERGKAITLSSSSEDVPVNRSNTCHHAASAYFAAIRVVAGAHIHIKKNIPIAAGLGGGSSDAAAVLLALNAHFRGRLSPTKLEALGATIGKDVPFFVRGGKACHASGTGETLRPIRGFPRTYFLIVNPGVAVSTAEAYQAIARCAWFMSNGGRTDISAAMLTAIRERNTTKIAATLFNDFEVCMEQLLPVIKEIKQALLAFGARGALMTGSGPTVFGLFVSKSTLLRAEKNLKKHYSGLVIAST
jgi:4-diphosphocytidyl-2-C-methyl-D-erythritol kinase